MGVRIRAEAVERIVASPSRFALQVEAPDDLPAALAAARLFRVDVVGLSGRGERPDVETGRAATAKRRADVSQVVPAPGGPLLLVQQLEAPPDDLARIPDLLARRLEDQGVGDATVAVPRLGGRLDALDDAPCCVVLRLFPGPATQQIPPDWLDVAVEWVTGDLGDADTVGARILSVEHEVAAPDAAGILHECGLARAWCDLVNGDPADRVRTASLTYGKLPHLALAAGGPGVDTAGLLARFELLRDVGRELAAGVAYACLDIEATFEGLGLGLPVDGWRARGGASPNRVAAVAADIAVPDAFPWQILGPGHVARFVEQGEEPPPHDALGDGRLEVGLGDPADWLPRSAARLDAQDDALAWLAPLLLDEDELAAVEAGRPTPQRPAPGTLPFAQPARVEPTGVPDLDAVTLRPLPSSRRSMRLTPLELAAWFAHEPHSDHPTSVSPVLASFVRWWAAGLDDEHLQRLKAYVPRMVGTAGDEGADRHRCWAATDWLVREQATAWLRAAGLVEAAERLAAVGELAVPGERDAELTKAVEVLGGAITVAGRRIDITASIVERVQRAGRGDGSDGSDDQLAWEAWEAAAEPAAWVAASEAATQGIPGEVAYATDLRVIECSRDPRAREELLATVGATVGATAWKVALRALAGEVWERAWRAADVAARELSGLTVRVEMGRVAKSSLPWDDGALEQAEEAARESLVKAALRSGKPDRDGEHPWDSARNAARSSPGGGAWSVVSDESRRAVGEEAWAQAMADARAVVDDLLDGARDVVTRSVVAAIAREACGAAARGVAYRAAAVARAHGADDAGAEEAAHAALAATTAELRESAYGLLDRLIEGKSGGAATTERG